MLDGIDALLPDLRALYEDLHANPELSFAEHRTAGILADRLAALGYEVTTGVGGTGVVAVLDNGPGPSVLLRADIDALPVLEDTGLPYASTARGTDPHGNDVPVAHACGHDMHATWLVGAATVLAAGRDRWSGRVVLAVQPAEEIGAGAEAMIADGLFERFGTPDVALGQHLGPAPAGWVFTRPGPVMAASDSLRVVLHGRGGHGSSPQSTIDPVVMAASTVMKLQTVVSRTVAPTDTAVLTVGTIHAGTKENIIADDAELTLNLRTFDPAVRGRMLEAIERIVAGEAASFGATTAPETHPIHGFPATVNDPATAARVADAFARHFGADKAMEGPLVTGSEDFGAFGRQGGFPSMFWFVGGTDAETWLSAFAEGRLEADIPTNHSPRFAPEQDPTIAAGIEAMVVAAMCWLAPDAPDAPEPAAG